MEKEETLEERTIGKADGQREGFWTNDAERWKGEAVDITSTLNEVLVKLFRDITTIEERALRSGEFKALSVNDMHVIEAIGLDEPKNMTTVAKCLGVTTGALTIAVNGLVKKGFVSRTRSEMDRRVVLVFLTERGRAAYVSHHAFHQEMVAAVLEGLDEEEQLVLERALLKLTEYFRGL